MPATLGGIATVLLLLIVLAILTDGFGGRLTAHLPGPLRRRLEAKQAADPKRRLAELERRAAELRRRSGGDSS